MSKKPGILIFLCLAGIVYACSDAPADGISSLVENHGFFETRLGCRTHNDLHEKDFSIAESRLQLELFRSTRKVDLKVQVDTTADLITEQGDSDLRQASLFFRPTEWMDIKLGRQILTWGTGDFIFINDLFPKDWNSFFIGRDTDYLKAPSDGAKVSFFTETVNLDLVYTPRFDADRYIDGRYLSYWKGSVSRHAGRDDILHTDRPGRWFRDDEYAARLYRTVNNYELAIYAYRGFWKSPAGMTRSGKALFPRLRVVGASGRGVVGRGIGNIEIGYYDSADDRRGKNPMINNSEIRYLIGYAQELAPDFTAGLQYYMEQMRHHRRYERGIRGHRARDEFRHLVTLRLTQLLMNQNLRLSLFAFLSPSDRDTHIRPNINYKFTDNFMLETGANIFWGDCPYSFFGQFEDNTNLYAAVRYSF